MASAEIERTTVEITASKDGKTAGLRATGSVIRFDGFIAAYTDAKEDGEQSDGDEEMMMHGCPRSMPGKPWPGRRSTPPSTSQSRRRAIRKPR
jgi:DNA topoisomerase IA